LKDLAIIGSGDLAIQINHLVQLGNSYRVIGFFDDYKTEGEEIVEGKKILGKIEDINHLFSQNKFEGLVNGIGYKYFTFREKVFNDFSSTIDFPNIIHPETILDRTVKLGKGNVIYSGCNLDLGVVLKDNILLNIGVSIAHHTLINSNSFLSPRVALAGFINVGKSCLLGINSTVIDNIEIANHVQLGGGTVVIKNLTKKGLYVGNPARFIR